MPPADDFASRPSSSKGSSSTRSNKAPLLSYLVPFPIPPEPVDDPLPFPFDIFFTIVEPALTIGGAIWAWFGPVNYHESLIPETVVPKPSTTGVDPHTSTVMAVRQLGNCYGLLAMMAYILLSTLLSTLRPHSPHLLLPILRAYFFVLAVADVTHIGWTLFDLGWSGSIRVSEWNALVFGNVGITTGLFIWRMWWFTTVGSRSKAAQRKGQ